jgi:rfaE bifunctional protein kinase chain/domain
MELLVIGDTLTDKYIYCEAKGISPEASVINWNVIEQKLYLGGAGNVITIINNILKNTSVDIDINITFASLLDDRQERMARDLSEVEVINLAPVEGYKGSVKNRLVSLNPYRHISRFDEDNVVIGNVKIPRRLKRKFDIALVSDYGKGFISKGIMQFSRSISDLVIVDPYKKDLNKYIDNVDIITPNRDELDSLVDKKVGLENSVQQKSLWLKYKLSSDGSTIVIAKMGSDGCLYYGNRPKFYNAISIPPNKVLDPTGAGDTFVSILIWSIITGESMDKAISNANKVAGYSTTRPQCYTFESQ